MLTSITTFICSLLDSSAKFSQWKADEDWEQSTVILMILKHLHSLIILLVRKWSTNPSCNSSIETEGDCRGWGVLFCWILNLTRRWVLTTKQTLKRVRVSSDISWRRLFLKKFITALDTDTQLQLWNHIRVLLWEENTSEDGRAATMRTHILNMCLRGTAALVRLPCSSTLCF